MDFNPDAEQTLCEPAPIQCDLERTRFEYEQTQFNSRWNQYALCSVFRFDHRRSFDAGFKISSNSAFNYNSEFEFEYDSGFDTGIALD